MVFPCWLIPQMPGLGEAIPRSRDVHPGLPQVLGNWSSKDLNWHSNTGCWHLLLHAYTPGRPCPGTADSGDTGAQGSVQRVANPAGLKPRNRR